MFEDVLVLLVSDLVEVIHVKLSHEGAEVSVSEVDGEDLLLEAVDVDDGEVGSFLVPAGDVGVAVVLNAGRSTSRI